MTTTPYTVEAWKARALAAEAREAHARFMAAGWRRLAADRAEDVLYQAASIAEAQGVTDHVRALHAVVAAERDRLRDVALLAARYNAKAHHVDGCAIRYLTTRPDAHCDCGKHALTRALEALDAARSQHSEEGV